MTLKVVGPAASDEELRLWLASHMKEHSHLTSAVLSRSDHIGLSRTAIDQYVEGTYFLPRESGGAGVDPKRSKTETMIRAYREKVEGTVRHGYANSFVETFSWKQLLSAWDTAIKENIIVVVYAKPGIGKTRCLTELSVRRMTTMPITVLCSPNVTVRYFVQRLAQEAGVSDSHTIPRLEDLVAEKLRRSPRPIVIDQANYLNEKSLGTICYLWEKAKIPIMLVGTTELYNLFNTSTLTEDVRAQLSSRVAMHYPLAELSVSECKALLTRALGEDATDANIAQIHQVTGGIYRSIEMIVPRIKDFKKSKRNAEGLANGTVKMEQIIDAAARRLMVG